MVLCHIKKTHCFLTQCNNLLFTVVVLLGWLVKVDVASTVGHTRYAQRLIDVDDLLPWHQMPIKVTDAEFVTVEQVQRFFTPLAWQALNDALANVKERNLWLCHACLNELSGRFVVACDSCLEWYDRVCVGLRNEPRGDVWFCSNCYT